MINVIILTMKSVTDTIQNRKNNLELFGYDFMIDEHHNAWLIEVNSSPSMEYSTVFIINNINK
jgi:tubulin monoglycylase TTLL3/8